MEVYPRRKDELVMGYGFWAIWKISRTARTAFEGVRRLYSTRMPVKNAGKRD
jgi:hypothetical protein